MATLKVRAWMKDRNKDPCLDGACILVVRGHNTQQAQEINEWISMLDNKTMREKRIGWEIWEREG